MKSLPNFSKVCQRRKKNPKAQSSGSRKPAEFSLNRAANATDIKFSHPAQQLSILYRVPKVSAVAWQPLEIFSFFMRCPQLPISSFMAVSWFFLYFWQELQTNRQTQDQMTPGAMLWLCQAQSPVCFGNTGVQPNGRGLRGHDLDTSA